MASSEEVNTSKIPFVETPFATADEFKVTDIDFLRNGVSRAMVTPYANGGMRFSRNYLNGIGYFATIGAFLDRMGYPYGIDRGRAEEIGGYPKGAILITEDDDYVREYVSQIDINTEPLPKEAADGTYVGNEFWKPTLPPTADFFPDFSISKHKAHKIIMGTGTYEYTADEDGWYRVRCQYGGSGWGAPVLDFDNARFRAICTVIVAGIEVARLDGRYAVKMRLEGDDRETWVIDATIPLKQGDVAKFSYVLKDGDQYRADISIARWGVTALD